MKIWQAILITILVYILGSYVSAFLGQSEESVFLLFPLIVVLPSAIWAYIDARKIEIHKYKSKFGFTLNKPRDVFLGMLVVWIIFFPWYLYFRSKVKRGEAELKKTA